MMIPPDETDTTESLRRFAPNWAKTVLVVTWLKTLDVSVRENLSSANINAAVEGYYRSRLPAAFTTKAQLEARPKMQKAAIENMRKLLPVDSNVSLLYTMIDEEFGWLKLETTFGF